jgi:hypothetical protein
VRYAAARMSSQLNGSTSKFGWLQAPATMNATAEMQWRSPVYRNVSSLEGVLELPTGPLSLPIR